MPRFVTCGPNEAIIVSGCCHANPTIRAGGRVFVWPMFHRIQKISLNTMTINVESPKVHSEGGVPVTVKGVAQVKIQGKDLASLRAASEMFLDKTEDEIMDIAKATLDGHQRSIIATLKIEDIYTKRKDFSKNVQQSAQNDLIDMGLTLVSYTVQDITDEEGYLDALGQEKTVAVKSEARKEVAKANSSSDVQNLDTEHTRQEAQLKHEHSIALKRLDFEIAKAKHLKEFFENKAKSEKAGDLQLAEMNKQIAREQLDVALLEKEKETDLILKKKQLKELELSDTIEMKADYECERECQIAIAMEAKEKARAEMEAESILRLAKARAEMIRLQKEADAEVLQQRAQAFMQFGNAAKLEMVLAMLPRLTAEIAGPITDCKKITSVSQDGSVGFSRITSEIMEVVEQIFDSVSTISGQSLALKQANDDDDRPGSSKRKSSSESVATTAGAPSRTVSSFQSRFGRNM